MSRAPRTASQKLHTRVLLLLRESMRDVDRDLTKGSLRKALVLLSIPMVLEMAMESVFALVDVFFVARLGAAAVAVVGLTEAMISLLYAVCIGFGMAVTAVVSRRIGENDPAAAALAAGQAIWISLVLASFIGFGGAIFTTELLDLMGAEAAVIDQGAGYTRILLGGSASIFYIFVLNAVFRGAGDAVIAMRSLWLANGVNLVLDPCFIFGLGAFPELGVAGAAVATTIGRSTGVAYQAYHLLRGSGRIRLGIAELYPDPAVMGRLIRVSLGGIGQFLISTSSWLLMIRIVATFGSAAIAGFTIAIRMVEFVFLPAWGLGNAAATIVGQNLGAGRPERSAAAAWMAAGYNVIAMSLVAIAFVTLAETFVGAFTREPDVFAFGVLCLRYLGFALPLVAPGMILAQAFNGAGDTATPTAMNFLCFWVIQIPLALFLAQQMAYGMQGVLFAMIIAEVLLSLIAILIFRSNRWQRQSV